MSETRRSVLKKLGLGGLALSTGSVGLANTASAASGNCETDYPKNPQKQWTADAQHDYSGGDYDLYQTTVVSYFCSWDGGRGWTHDVDVGTVASGQWSSGSGYNSINRNLLEIWPRDYESGGEIDRDSTHDTFGWYPESQDGNVDDFIETSMDLVIGTFYAPAGFVVALDDIAETFEPYADGISHPDKWDSKGVRIKSNTGTFENAWQDAGQYQRFKYFSGSNADSDDDVFVVSEMHDMTTSSGDWLGTRIKYEMSFWELSQPSVIRRDSVGSGSGDVLEGDDLFSLDAPVSAQESKQESKPVRTKKAEEMTPEERERYGVRRVDKENPSKFARYAKEVDGELPEWVATNIPISITAHQQYIKSGEVDREEKLPVKARGSPGCKIDK
ncbi:twin-arginine translocation signal domain-containing protein [Haloferax sp. S1W]|uniref:twin-arginine translocation signal domain-containing protein n=1 Tax=Haloferax sp. S1W TaxID=3377110 RepID=UPI0037CB61F8